MAKPKAATRGSACRGEMGGGRGCSGAIVEGCPRGGLQYSTQGGACGAVGWRWDVFEEGQGRVGRGQGCLDLDLAADLKGHRTPREGGGGGGQWRPDDSSDPQIGRRHMKCKPQVLDGPLPPVPSGVAGPRWRWATLCLMREAPTALDGLVVPSPLP